MYSNHVSASATNTIVRAVNQSGRRYNRMSSDR